MATELVRGTGRLAIVIGLVTFASVASLTLFYAVAGPFGAINDWLIGLVGILTGLLALVIWRRGGPATASAGALATGVAVLGSAIVIVGSALVISRTTGFFLAGLVESLGFALVGAWLITLNRSMSSAPRWSRRLRTFGSAAGAIMAIGVVVLPAIATGLDDMDAAPAWVWIGFLGWLGIFFLYPAWCIWFGTALRSDDVVGSAA